MSNNRIFNFNVLDEEINPNNIVAISEIVAFSQTRFLIGYMGNHMQKIYADLYSYIKNKHNINQIFSDGYDLVHEGVSFLCEHYGEHIHDVICINKKGKQVTLRTMCIKRIRAVDRTQRRN